MAAKSRFFASAVRPGKTVASNQRKPGTVPRLEVLGGVLVQNLVPIALRDSERIDECRMNAVE